MHERALEDVKTMTCGRRLNHATTIGPIPALSLGISRLFHSCGGTTKFIVLVDETRI